MEFHRATLETCGEAQGVVIVIDVLRAFSTAAYAFAAGAQAIVMVSTVEEALSLRGRLPGVIVMGEVGGLPVPGFDLSNSPTEISKLDLNGKLLVQRTSSGTQGMVRSLHAEHLLAGSLVCAAATASYVRLLKAESVTIVNTGIHEEVVPFDDPYNGEDGGEDAACADYLESLLKGENPDPSAYVKRVLDSRNGQIFADPSRPEFPASDLDYCTRVNAFDFAMRAQLENGLLTLRKMDMYNQAGIRNLKGKIHWEGNLDEQRQARFTTDE